MMTHALWVACHKYVAWCHPGYFHRAKKLHNIVWNKAWENLTSVSYFVEIWPLISLEKQEKTFRIWIQVIASCHVSSKTNGEMDRLGVNYMLWPSLSLDLNLIESNWSTMRGLHGEKISWRGNKWDGVRSREAITFKWTIWIDHRSILVIRWGDLANLIEIMPKRCQTVIDSFGITFLLKRILHKFCIIDFSVKKNVRL